MAARTESGPNGSGGGGLGSLLRSARPPKREQPEARKTNAKQDNAKRQGEAGQGEARQGQGEGAGGQFGTPHHRAATAAAQEEETLRAEAMTMEAGMSDAATRVEELLERIVSDASASTQRSRSARTPKASSASSWATTSGS